MSTTNMSLSANDIFNKILDSRGRFVKVRYKSNPSTKAEFKGVNLEKVTTTIIQAGVAYENLKTVKEAIASGERDEVGELPWGEWLVVDDKSFYPYLITHKDTLYLRMTPSQTGNHKGETHYFVDGVEVDKDKFAGYLTNSEAKKLLEKSEGPVVYNIKLDNLLDLPIAVD